MLTFLREMEDHPAHPMSNYDFLSGNGYQMKQLGYKIYHQDSSSSKSGQSHQESSAMSESTLNEQHTSTQSDNDDGHVKHNQDTTKSELSLVNPEASFLPPKLDYSQSFVHGQLNGTTNSRVPLSLEPAAEEPILVNAKQYHAILRRRQIRAKLEAQNKLVKAWKRARGSGGRFINTKQLEGQKQQQQQASGGASCTKALGKNTCLQSDPTSCTFCIRSLADCKCFNQQQSAALPGAHPLSLSWFQSHNELQRTKWRRRREAGCERNELLTGTWK